jgi:hypothetical protein
MFFQSYNGTTIQYIKHGRFFLETFFTFFELFSNRPQKISPAEILSLKSSILPVATCKYAQKMRTSASFALLFVKNYMQYAILDLGDKYSAGYCMVDSKMLHEITGTFLPISNRDNARGTK